jgi:hypothetical protein
MMASLNQPIDYAVALALPLPFDVRLCLGRRIHYALLLPLHQRATPGGISRQMQ